MLMRAANSLFSGFDMALWDLQGRRAGLPVHRLFGGAHRDRVGYFHFTQGDTPEELAADAARAAAAGERVFYLKVGRGERLDLEIVRAVRREIGDARLRLDANEAWDPHDAIRMCRRLEPFDIEFVEQPTPSWSIEALAQVKASVGIPIVADQSAFTLHDVYEICRRRAADMICIGPREIGGIRPMLQVAAIAEAAGLRICIHGSFTSGITSCAEHQAALAIPNLDDGNQIMWQLLRDDLVAAPDLRRGRAGSPRCRNPVSASALTAAGWRRPSGSTRIAADEHPCCRGRRDRAARCVGADQGRRHARQCRPGGACDRPRRSRANPVCGLFYLPIFAGQLKVGKVDGRAEPKLAVASAAITVDAGHGFAHPAIEAALPELAGTAKRLGVAAASVSRSTNCLALAHHVTPLAARGLIGLVASNAPASVAPPGATARLFGTNPLAFAVPVADGPPIVVDQSLSAVTKTAIIMRRDRGEAIPEGWRGRRRPADPRPRCRARRLAAAERRPEGRQSGALRRDPCRRARRGRTQRTRPPVRRQ